MRTNFVEGVYLMGGGVTVVRRSDTSRQYKTGRASQSRITRVLYPKQWYQVEYERLQKENAKLKEALRPLAKYDIAEMTTADVWQWLDTISKQAKETLSHEND